MSDKPLKQKGFTLIELLIVMLISGIIVAAVGTAIIQVFRVNTLTSDSVAAFNQVQIAGFWISHDAVMAHAVTVNNSETGELQSITLDWVDWENDAHHVVYTLNTSGEFKRTHSINGALQGTVSIAQNIDPENTNCTWDRVVLTLNITAQVGEQTANRTYIVESRPLS